MSTVMGRLSAVRDRLRLRERVARRRTHASYMQALRGLEQQALVDRLRAEIGSVDHFSSGSSSWDAARQRLVDHIRADDPREFLTWDEVRSTMFVLDAPYVSIEFKAILSQWERWKSVLVEDPSGCPTPSRFGQTTSDNLIHHVYHVLAAEERLGSIRGFDEILEFGGGYGSFARVMRRLGCASRYHIHDLPEFAALQRYYLASVAEQRGEPSICEGITWGSSTDELPGRPSSRLFVGLWSLSETPVRDREPWRDVIAGCDGALIAFQREFEGADNRSWFNALQRQVEFDWSCWEIPHLQGNFYLMGRRQGNA